MRRPRRSGWDEARGLTRSTGRWRAGLPGLTSETGVLAVLYIGGALASWLAAIFPMSPQAPTNLNVAMGVVAALVAAGLLLGGSRLPRFVPHVLLVASTIGTCTVVAASHTNGGAMMAGFTFSWLALYAALFLSARAQRVHAATITVGFGAGLLASGLPATLTEWIIVSGTVWAVVIVIGDLSLRLNQQADSDPLTGLLNRNGFLKAATREVELAARTTNPLAAAVIDLDDFKLVNDLGGHASGDRLLADLAHAWEVALRPGDILARHGGDEFVLLLPATSAAGAQAALGRLRGAHDAGWSAGVAEWRPGETLADCLARADAHLYRAKMARAGDPRSAELASAESAVESLVG